MNLHKYSKIIAKIDRKFFDFSSYLYYNHKHYTTKEIVMKKFIHAWNKASLIKRILIGMLIGGTLG